jgi:hypothetical protein
MGPEKPTGLRPPRAVTAGEGAKRADQPFLNSAESNIGCDLLSLKDTQKTRVPLSQKICTHSVLRL